MNQYLPYKLFHFIAAVMMLASLPACTQVQAAENHPTTAPMPSKTPLLSVTATQIVAAEMPTPTATTRPETEICPPFSGWDQLQLIQAISNPFHPPAPGSDDPHQGVDFSDLDPVYGYARTGLEIMALLPGRVAGVIANRFPYGNAVLIETSLIELNPALILPDEIPIPTLISALTCPPGAELEDSMRKPESVYLLYAHMQDEPRFSIGDSIACGQVIGSVGESGNALAPHLHLEVRVGTAGQQFSSMAHYISSASEIEMANYCVWRTSGGFVLLDPMLLIDRLP